MKKLILSAAFLAFAGFTTVQASDSKINNIDIVSVQDSVVKTPIKLEELPAAITESLKKAYPEAVITKAYKNIATIPSTISSR